MGAAKNKRKGWSKAKRNREQRRLVARAAARWCDEHDETLDAPGRVPRGNKKANAARMGCMVVDDFENDETERTPEQIAAVYRMTCLRVLPPLSDVARWLNLGVDTMERIRVM